MIAWIVFGFVLCATNIWTANKAFVEGQKHKLKQLQTSSWSKLIEAAIEDIKSGDMNYKWEPPDILLTPHAGKFHITENAVRNQILEAFHQRYRYQEAQKYLQENSS